MSLASSGASKAEVLADAADLLDGEKVAIVDITNGARLETYTIAGERGVLTLVAKGLSNAEIGSRLYVSPATVKTHVAKVYDKLGVTNRRAAVRRGAELDLLSHSRR